MRFDLDWVDRAAEDLDLIDVVDPVVADEFAVRQSCCPQVRSRMASGSASRFTTGWNIGSWSATPSACG